MNRIYQVIWSSVRDCYVVVSENAGRHGKKKAVHLAPSTTKRTMLAMSLGAAVLFGSAASVSAAAGQVLGGGGTESGDTSSAKGEDATISGGFVNHAEGNYSSVSGGTDNQAFGEDSSVSGGGQNKATGKGASVAGGFQNQAGGEFSTVSGGSGNKAFGWGSIVIGGNGNVTGKVAVDAKGDPLKDANNNQYPANQGLIGQVSVAIGGVSSSVQGNYSVGIAGGSTSEGAYSGLAAGNKATVTVANGVAIGYEATASVIDPSRAADTEGRIVSFGHKKGDKYYTVQYQNHTVTENEYDSDAYNRLVNVADGIDDHDVVVMEQLKEQLKAVESKGLNFQGNNDTTVHINQGGTLQIQGSGTKASTEYSGENILVTGVSETANDGKTVTTKLNIGLDKNIRVDSVTAGQAAPNSVQGYAGSVKIVGPSADSTKYEATSLTTAYDTSAKSVKDATVNRLQYTDGDGTTRHTVATLDDGLKLAGDAGTGTVNLDSTLTVTGGETNDANLASGKNIGVTASDGKLQIQLAKNLTGLSSITAGTVVMGYQTVISEGKVSSPGNYVTGLGNTTWDGTDYVSGRAATEDQLKKVSDSIQTSVNSAQFGITAGGLADGGDVTIKQNLGSAIRIYGDAPVTNEKNDGSGDFWDRSKANILTKVKKDHDGNDYVSVELQDHLEVGTHAGKDTAGKDVAGVDGSMQFKGTSAKEVNITGDTGIALSDNGNQTAALRQDNGTGYLDLAGSEGAFTSLFTKKGTQNLASDQDSASNTRLAYTDKSSKTEHQVATLDDGLVVAGDNGQVTRLLNSTLKLSGGEKDETKLSRGQNIGVVANKDNDGQLDIKLAKDLTDIDSITMTGGLTLNSTNGSSTITGLTNTSVNLPDFGKAGRAATEEQLKLMQSSITQSAQGGGFGLTADGDGAKAAKADLGSTIGIHGDNNITTAVSEDGKSIDIKLNNKVDLGTDGSLKAGGVTINSSGIDAGSKNITNVASGIVNKDDSDNTNAANIGDVKTLAGEAAKTEIGKLGSRDFAGDDGETVSRGLGESMKLSGGADTSKLTNGNIGVVKNAAGDGLDIKLSKELTGLTSVTTGNSTLNNDGLTINNSEGKAGTTITNGGIKIAANGDNTHAVEVTNSNVSMGGQQIHDVAPGTADGDAVNVSQLKKSVGALGGAIDKVDRRVDRVGAGAAALAALHPQDFDPDDKWDFAVGYGNYRGANAAAVGAFYRPNEDTTFSVGGTVGGGENMVNAGVSFKFGQGNHVSNSRVAMAKEIKDLRKEVESLRSALVDVAAGKQLDPAKTKLFPDMPKNHWAYKEISELAGNGLIDGYPDGEFKGDRMMTRYEFASIVYRQMMAGRELSDRLVQEFEPELERIRIDVIARHKDGTPSIERVRVNKPADKNSK